MKEGMLTVTSPLLPDLDEFKVMLDEIWQSKWITNNGRFHRLLEQELANYLKVPYVCLFTNGTLPLLTALQALNVRKEVITTPFSFVATAHAIMWNGCKPVFVDIDPKTGNIDPDMIEAAITEKTQAILPVHVYGHPCDTERIQDIANRYNLKVIYDAAHAFGVEQNKESILKAGDMSTISFHATKVFNTIEGGAMVVHDQNTKTLIDNLKNFGFRDEVTIVSTGINGKMDELRSAYGLLNLKMVDEAIAYRKTVAVTYRKALEGVDGISLFCDYPDIRYNYSYFPIMIDAARFGMSRDELYLRMKEKGILSRRYFYPLISQLQCYKENASAKPENLPNAHKMADSVLCLPMHHCLSEPDIERVLEFFK